MIVYIDARISILLSFGLLDAQCLPVFICLDVIIRAPVLVRTSESLTGACVPTIVQQLDNVRRLWKGSVSL